MDPNIYLRPVLLCKACQSGKTGEALKDWVTEQMRINVSENTINRKIGIFICDNSLLLTKQTNIRAHSEEIAIDGDIETISCNTSIKRVDKLESAIVENNKLSTILCCGNHRRLKDISELLLLLAIQPENYEFFIYIDEADKILHSKNAKKQFEIWRSHSLVAQITLITATPYERSNKGLTADFGEIELLPVSNIVAPTYHSLADSILIDSTGIKALTNIDYVEEVFKQFVIGGPQCGEVWFIPGEHKISTHDTMQKLLFELGFNCVLKINGKQKEITIMKHQSDDESSIESEYSLQVKTFRDIHDEILQGADLPEFSPYNNELSRWLERYYIRNNGNKDWKFAITGNVCISRGISIQSPGCLITHAVYGPKCARSKTGQYQMFARVCGNIKQFPNYLKLGPPKIICSRKMFNKSCKMERRAMEISQISQKKYESERTVIDCDYITS